MSTSLIWLRKQSKKPFLVFLLIVFVLVGVALMAAVIAPLITWPWEVKKIPVAVVAGAIRVDSLSAASERRGGIERHRHGVDERRRG